MVQLVFLGTAGGRFATIHQRRRTGGILVKGDIQMHIDPGPGALRSAWHFGEDPTRTRVIFVSHSHTEHYSDAEVLIEAMTDGGWNPRGTLLAARSVVEETGGMGPSISRYHRGLVGSERVLVPGDRMEVDGFDIEATPTVHTDPSGVGLKLHTEHGAISFVSDTSYSEDVAISHMDAKVLVLNVTIRREIGGAKHLTPEKAAEFIVSVGPELAVITHMGKQILKDGPDELARSLQEQTGVNVLAADDGTVLDVAEDIKKVR